jgi:hypothetical protein
VTPFDCKRCGACCVNPLANRAEGHVAYVAVVPRDAILRHPRLVDRYVRSDDEGGRHLRLDPGHRCLALKGSIGHQVRCEIYALRPAACRRVTPGDADCLRARREAGITT